MSQTTWHAQGIASPNLVHLKAPDHPVARGWRYVLRLIGQVRRQYLSRVRPGYVARMRSRRLGKCRACGACCHLTFHCPFLTRDRLCDCYAKRSITCRDFPIDAMDLKLTCVPCGHYFAPRSEEEGRADSAD
jgi:hypothetical protein